MLTVAEAAKHTARHPGTIRRWIREGKLRSRKVGARHMIDQQDLDIADPPGMLPLPKSWRWDTTSTGDPMPNVAAWIRDSRHGH
jgi:excisionase family DNA binding protein